MSDQTTPEPGKPLVAGYISEENGQGMGVPARCTLWRIGHVCNGAIQHNGRFYQCRACQASYGN